MDLIEINEAFAAVTLTATKMLANDNEKKWKEILERLMSMEVPLLRSSRRRECRQNNNAFGL